MATPERAMAKIANRYKILVVDDEAPIRHMAKMMLEHAGYEALEAEGGHEAIGIFEADPQAADLVLLDMTMPDVDGHETLRALRGLRRDLKVIVITGCAEEEFDSADETSPDAFLLKPFQMTDLYATLNAVLEKHRSDRSAGSVRSFSLAPL